MGCKIFTDYDNVLIDLTVTRERVRKKRKPKMPVHRGIRATRASRRTAASRKASRRIARRAGGIHLRRRHKATRFD